MCRCMLGGAALELASYAEGHLRSLYEGRLPTMARTRSRGCGSWMHLAAERSSLTRSPMPRSMRGVTKWEAAAATVEKPRTRRPGDRGDVIRPRRPWWRRRSEVARDLEVPEPPFWGSRVIEGHRPDTMCYAYINPVALFRVQWQFKRGSAPKRGVRADAGDKAVHPIVRSAEGLVQCRDEGTHAAAGGVRVLPVPAFGWTKTT